MKKLLSMILIAAMLLALAVPALAFEGDLDFEDLTDLIEVVENAAEDLPEIENAASVVSGFQSFLNVIDKAGSVLVFINGSVAFLKLIGLMEDPAADASAQMLEQIGIMNEKINQIDSKLDSLAQELKEMAATIELNNRGAKAYNMRLAWKDFSEYYMQDGMEKLMTQFNAMLVTGLMKWCANADGNARNYNGVDNRQLVILYGEDEDGAYMPVYSDCAPSAIAADCPRYAVLKEDCLPASFSYDADSFQTDLAADIAARIRTALDEENYDAFDCLGIPMLTPEGKSDISDEAVAALAADAVSSLVYRVGCAEVNESADFAYEVDRQFTNYCAHLLSSEEGIDAMFKSFFLTHSFEFEVREELQDFCNRMILKTGTYGMFALNVLGMSHAADSSKKTAAAERFYDTGMALENAKKSAFTGEDNYCYVTNTKLEYVPIFFDSDATVKVYHSGEITAFRGSKAGAIEPSFDWSIDRGGSLIGDEKGLVLFYTLSAADIDYSLYDYLRLNIGFPYYPEGCEPILTSFGAEQTLPLDDSKADLLCRKAIGNWFPEGGRMTISTLPKKATDSYIQSRSQICGNTVDFSAGTLRVNTPLHAMVVYGENEWYWYTDEAAVLGGVAGRDNYTSSLTLNKVGYDHTYSYTSRSTYNTLYSIPLPKRLESEGVYDPFLSYVKLYQEMEDQIQHPIHPVLPIDIPEIGSVRDIDLTGTVWDVEPTDEAALAQYCAELTQRSAAEAGVTLTDTQKKAVSDAMTKHLREAEQRIAEDETLYPDDPLGIGQDTPALWDEGAALLPDYLLDSAGAADGDLVCYIFVRLHHRAIPSLNFCDNGDVEIVITTETLPYLLVGEISSGKFQWLDIPFDETRKTSSSDTYRLTLPSSPSPTPAPTAAPEKKAPPTGDDSAVLLYGMLMFLLPAAAWILRRKKAR